MLDDDLVIPVQPETIRDEVKKPSRNQNYEELALSYARKAGEKEEDLSDFSLISVLDYLTASKIIKVSKIAMETYDNPRMSALCLAYLCVDRVEETCLSEIAGGILVNPHTLTLFFDFLLSDNLESPDLNAISAKILVDTLLNLGMKRLFSIPDSVYKRILRKLSLSPINSPFPPNWNLYNSARLGKLAYSSVVPSEGLQDTLRNIEILQSIQCDPGSVTGDSLERLFSSDCMLDIEYQTKFILGYLRSVHSGQEIPTILSSYVEKFVYESVSREIPDIGGQKALIFLDTSDIMHRGPENYCSHGDLAALYTTVLARACPDVVLVPFSDNTRSFTPKSLERSLRSLRSTSGGYTNVDNLCLRLSKLYKMSKDVDTVLIITGDPLIVSDSGYRDKFRLSDSFFSTARASRYLQDFLLARSQECSFIAWNIRGSDYVNRVSSSVLSLGGHRFYPWRAIGGYTREY